MPTLTISGLASGLDTDEIIQKLMEIERQPVKRLEQRKADLEVDKNAWRDIGTRLSNLLSTLTALKLESTFKAMTATPSDPKVLTATATADAATGTYRIWIKQLAQAHKVASDPQTSISSPLNLSGTFTITVGGVAKSIAVVTGDTLATIRDKINDPTSGAGTIVTASIVDNRLIVTSKTTGAGGAMTFNDPDNILKVLGVLTSTGSIKNQLLNPQDAEFTVDNLTVFRSKNEVNDVIPGVTLNLLGVTDTANPGVVDANEVITLQVTRNTQAAVDAVQKFIDQYNSAMDFIASKLGKTATGQPGDLFADPTLARIQQELRELVFGPVNLTGTKYTSAGSVGISTGAVSPNGLTFDRSGKLTLDTAKFTAALEADAQGVYNLFASSSANGIAVRLDEYLKKVTKVGLGTTPSAGDGIISTKQKWIDLTIKDIDEQIARWEDRLALREEQLRRQFTAMESMLGTLQSQANWLAGQIASLQSLNLARTQK